jgi:hypothetical protein
MARHLPSLRRVAEQVGRTPRPADYRAAWRELNTAGEEIIEIHALINFFGPGRLAKEALELAEITTPMKIEARFRSRLTGKVHRYRDDQLREALLRCSEALDGRPPLVAEYEASRRREIELAKTAATTFGCRARLRSGTGGEAGRRRCASSASTLWRSPTVSPTARQSLVRICFRSSTRVGRVCRPAASRCPHR